MNCALFVRTVLIFSLLNGTIWGVFNRNNDIQFWEGQFFEYKISPRTSLRFSTEYRWGDNASILYLSYLEGNVFIKLKDWLTIAPSYRHTSLLLPAGGRFTIYDPFFDVIFKFHLGRWEVQERNRVDRLFFEIGPDLWQYRNRVKLISPWKWGKLKFNPYMFNEIFIRQRLGYSEDRLAFGGRFHFSKSASSELFYIQRWIKFPDWRPTHVMGLYFLLHY